MVHGPALQNDPECGILLMDESGSVGLDLSFVGYVFLMEPLADASLETQVISRAHRMGAQHTVYVETLAMKVTQLSSRLAADCPFWHSWLHVACCCVKTFCMGAWARGQQQHLVNDSDASWHKHRPLSRAPCRSDVHPMLQGTAEQEMLYLRAATDGGDGSAAAAAAAALSESDSSEPAPLAGAPVSRKQAAGAARFGAGRSESATLAVPVRTADAATAVEGVQPVAGERHVSSSGTAAGASQGTVSATGEAQRRNIRNRMFTTLHRVAVAQLPEYHDLPMAENAQTGANLST